MEILAEHEWHALRKKHEARVRPWIEPRLARASRNERHPVDDFLFEYYAYRPAKLVRWHPGIGVALQGESAHAYLVQGEYQETPEGVTAAASKLPGRRMESIRWLRNLLDRTGTRPAAFGCFGLHEWAMIHQANSIRHAQWPLRVSLAEVARAVESLGLRCTHYDAFRFFTPAARPLNKYQPTREATLALEQPGCLHANMDLYKWAFKLAPFTPSDLVADCFELAFQIRALDMRASPYDLTALGYLPVRVETAEGRAEYEALQREFAGLASPLRNRLQVVCDRIIEKATPGRAEGADSSPLCAFA
jgi:hypothetical protein